MSNWRLFWQDLWMPKPHDSKYNVVSSIQFMLKRPVIYYVVYLMIGITQIPA
jgi:hypothetical protein